MNQLFKVMLGVYVTSVRDGIVNSPNEVATIAGFNEEGMLNIISMLAANEAEPVAKRLDAIVAAIAVHKTAEFVKRMPKEAAQNLMVN
jgi:hypothetical protein